MSAPAGIVAAAALVGIAHEALRAAAEPGVSEFELWQAVQEAVGRATGAPVVANIDLMSGPRTALVGEPPTDRRLVAGDAVLFDFAPLHDGWWADSCTTFAVGPAPPALRRRHEFVLGALEAGLAAARPGARAGDLDAVVRGALARHGLSYPHHTGHGVGAEAQQDPWIVPGGDAVLEEGMVIALEPGAYDGGFGVRLEHLAVVTANGAEPLTSHPLALSSSRAARPR